MENPRLGFSKPRKGPPNLAHGASRRACRSEGAPARRGGRQNAWTGWTSLIHSYSVLSAVTGEIDAAREAGIMAAKKAQRARALAATVSASGSQLETP